MAKNYQSVNISTVISFRDITKSDDIKFPQKLTQWQENYPSIKISSVISFRDDFKKI